MKNNRQNTVKRIDAKQIPTLVMGVIGLFAFMVSLVVNEPLVNMQMQEGCLVAPSQVVSFMLQAALL